MIFEIAIAAALTVPPPCSIDLPLVRTTDRRNVVLARATGETERVTIPEHLRASFPDSITELVAHRFSVLDVTGEGAGLRDAATYLVVPLAYRPSCQPLMWEGAWVPSGAEVTFLFSEPGAVIAGEPLFDALGWHTPYPYGRLIRYQARPQPPADVAEWLSAREYFSLVSALPLVADGYFYEDRRDEIEGVFAEGDPRWSQAFPGAEILRRAQRR